MANDKNLRANTNLFPLEVLQNQTGWSKALLAELCGVSYPLMTLVFDRKRTLSAEAVAKLRRFLIPGLKKRQNEYLKDPQNLPFKNDSARRNLQSMLVKLRAKEATTVLKLDRMREKVNTASENAFHLEHQMSYIKANKLASRSELISLDYYKSVAKVRCSSVRVKKVFQLESALAGLKAEISHVESLLDSFGTKKRAKK
jgi:hypothetical protein